MVIMFSALSSMVALAINNFKTSAPPGTKNQFGMAAINPGRSVALVTDSIQPDLLGNLNSTGTVSPENGVTTSGINQGGNKTAPAISNDLRDDQNEVEQEDKNHEDREDRENDD